MCKANKWRHSRSCILIINKLLLSNNKADFWYNQNYHSMFIWSQVCQLYKQWCFNLIYVYIKWLCWRITWDTAYQSLLTLRLTLLTRIFKESWNYYCTTKIPPQITQSGFKNRTENICEPLLHQSCFQNISLKHIQLSSLNYIHNLTTKYQVHQVKLYVKTDNTIKTHCLLF